MTYVSQVIADGAVGFWELAETSPGSAGTATDQTANQNGVYGTGNWSNVTGIPGGGGATAVAPTTANAANKVAVAALTAQNLPDSAFSIEFWVKRSSTQGATQRLIGGANSGTASIGFQSTNTLYIEKSSTSTIANSTNTITDTTTWHHVVWTKAGATNHLYVDGTDVTGTVTNATVNTTSGWNIFENSALNNPPPIGLAMAMVAIYPTALSSTVVANHHTLGSSAASAPVNTVAPAVTGTTAVGSVLTTTNGTWTDDGSPTFTYQWKNASGNITGATSSTYTLVDADDATSIHCTVTDSTPDGNTSADSNTVGPITEPIPTNSVAPSVSGSAPVGSVLTSTTGTWTHQGGTVATYAYQWTRAGVNISAATSSTYTTVTADIGSAVGCTVKATNTGGTSTGTASSNTVTVTAASSVTSGAFTPTPLFRYLLAGGR